MEHFRYLRRLKEEPRVLRSISRSPTKFQGSTRTSQGRVRRFPRTPRDSVECFYRGFKEVPGGRRVVSEVFLLVSTAIPVGLGVF